MMTIANSVFPNRIIPPISLQGQHLNPLTLSHFHKTPLQHFNGFSSKLCFCSETSIFAFTTSSSDSEKEEQEDDVEPNSFLSTNSSNGVLAPPVLKKKKRYRKEYPGESKGITEEMRFIAMKLHNDKGSLSNQEKCDGGGDDSDGVWVPSMEGFLKYLVDSKLVFETIEGFVEDSNDVS
ncbi:putative inactive heme oxygenase 2 chloroplastic [Bienertia sinuspersici]